MIDNTSARSAADRPRQQKSIRSEADFRARLAELGVTLLDPYLGSGVPHRAVCAKGHSCAPRPTVLRRGLGPCRACSGTDPKAAEAAFRARVAELGGVVLGLEWRGVDEPHLVRCANGHSCTPRPNHVLRGTGLCVTCAGQDTQTAEARFIEHVATLGGVVVGPWRNTHTRVRVRCAVGHESSPVPYLSFARGSICRICGGRDAEAAWAVFRARVEELGGTVLESGWRGALVPHRVQCAEGHEVSPRPGDVQQGQGICRRCRGRAWDVFYVVADDLMDVVKFGITSGNPQRRLVSHEREGLDRVVRLHIGLPGDAAPELERTIIAALRDAREAPVRGREYYRGRALALVLDLVDNHPDVRASI